MLPVRFDVKSVREGFFNRNAVLAAVGRAKAKVLNRAGAMLRLIAQRSMRYRKKAAAPGSPPSAHKEGRGPLLREHLYYAWDPSTQGVFVGSVLLSRSKLEATVLSEYGGTVMRKVMRGKKAKQAVMVRATYPARPYMGPALREATPRLAQLWQNSVKA